jgi:dienelactone hydrolase
MKLWVRASADARANSRCAYFPSSMSSSRRLISCFFVFLFPLLASAAEREVVRLWSGTAPGSEGRTAEEKVRIAEGGDHVVTSVHQPSLTVYLPEGSTPTAAVLVIPGGGHRELWMDHEGYNVAQWLADRGIAAFILKYRLAREEGSTYKVDVESLQDAQRALRTIRHRAAEWRVDPARLGVLGFSAGGELAALAAARGSDAPSNQGADVIDALSSRVAFQALIYPGRSDSILPEPSSPAAFLLCGANDRPDISEGLAKVYLRFKTAKVLVELHIYAHAGHGFGVRPTNHTSSAGWIDRFREWLTDGRFLEAK